MTVGSATWEQVRYRAASSCEFCGVSETDAGGQLTVDHFQPKTKGGMEDLENLIYCCFRCNQYKHDYWPSSPGDPRLWNPRCEPFRQHFVESDDGRLHPLTAVGTFTIRRLRLNRPPLVARRLLRLQRAAEARLLRRYRNLAKVLAQLNREKTILLEEQRVLLAEQRDMLRRLLEEG
jgi:hypothetical protein